MAVRKYGEGPRGVPEPARPSGERGPKISSILAENVGKTTNVVKDLRLLHGETDLSGRCSKESFGDTKKVQKAISGKMPT